MGNERVLCALSYLEQGNPDLAPLEAMGLSARELDDVIALAPWGRGVPFAMRAAVEELCEERARVEGEAGLRLPIVVVPAPTHRGGTLARGLVVLLLLGAVVAAAVVGARAGAPDAAPAPASVTTTAPAAAPQPKKSRTPAPVPSGSRSRTSG